MPNHAVRIQALEWADEKAKQRAVAKAQKRRAAAAGAKAGTKA